MFEKKYIHFSKDYAIIITNKKRKFVSYLFLQATFLKYLFFLRVYLCNDSYVLKSVPGALSINLQLFFPNLCQQRLVLTSPGSSTFPYTQIAVKKKY